jgi:tetratricopeptide (TPR) repeat protein
MSTNQKAVSMKRTLFLVACLLVPPGSRAQSKPAAAVREDLGHLHHPIETTSLEAQSLFDEGLTLVYGFNHDEAIRRFQRASALDPKAAMPLWGIALALGPNINLDVDPQHEEQAYTAEQKALAMASSAPESERDYIEALAKRYSNDPKADLRRLAVDYANAMRDVSHTHPDDLDAAALFAESLMDLHPWQLWTLDGKPGEYTEEIISVLEATLRRDPNHIGANHYYIHTMEASPRPEAALPSALRLETLVPSAGHLVHMPAHIYQRTGDYARAALANERGAAADRAYLAAGAPQHGMYGMMYYSHNLHFLAASSMMEGRLAAAREAAAKLDAYVRPGLAMMPFVESFLVWPTFVELRFARWNEILQLPAPDAKLVMSSYFWHFARGRAFAATKHLDQARAERAAMEGLRKDVPAGPAFGMLYNDATLLLDIAANSLDARIAFAAGDHAAAIASWQKAVTLEDGMNYDEPEEWYYPARESLGAALLLDGRAAEAETVFREDLNRHQRNPRSLFGLWQSLAVQNKPSDADWVHRQFLAAWKRADVKMSLADF